MCTPRRSQSAKSRFFPRAGLAGRRRHGEHPQMSSRQRPSLSSDCTSQHVRNKEHEEFHMSSQFSRQANLVAIKPIVRPNCEFLTDVPGHAGPWQRWHISHVLSYVHTIGILTLIWLCACLYPNNVLMHIHPYTICMPMYSLIQPVAYTFNLTCMCTHIRTLNISLMCMPLS